MNRRKRSRKGLVWVIIFVVLFVVAGVVGYFVWDGYFREKKADGEAPAADVVKEEVKRVEVKMEPEAAKTEEKQNVGEDGKEVIVQYEGDDPNEGDAITGAITYLGKSAGQLVVRVNIDQYLASGTCALTLRNGGGLVHSETAEVVTSASTATCAGFNVPVEGLPGGSTQVIVTITSGEKNGEIRGEVEL